jgi:hypothetical protein
MVWVAKEDTMLREIDISLDVFIASPPGRLKVKLKTLPGLHLRTSALNIFCFSH